VPGIKASGTSGPVTISNGTSVSIKVSLDPGNRPVKKTDWWVAAQTLFAPPNNWYTYVCPKGWQPGIHVCIQMPPFQILPSFEVLNMADVIVEMRFTIEFEVVIFNKIIELHFFSPLNGEDS
jgi:hypothetical protein